MVVVRPALPTDRAAVVATIVAAFTGDPAWTWLLGADFSRLAPLFAGALFDQRVDGGTVWMTEDAASVSLWDPPGSVDPLVEEAAWAPFHAAAGAGAAARFAAYEGALDRVSPTWSYWYLGVLATRPERAGRGLATAVMAPGLSRADADGLDACLETSTLANRAFYDRRGFVESTLVDLPDAPDTWWLRRPAQ
ncbi:MAG: GNAT family N-acetyltransferase [Actinobacteria bacterium]|nr:GNAT family N-acetyltransferase [Actinomycetota bacterium]